MSTNIHISLVIPVRNESISLATLLNSIRRQSRLPDEVILIDGGSTDNTLALARELTEYDSRFHVLEAGPSYPGTARNVGIRAAQHEWIALTDAGITLDPDWLKELTAVVEGNPDVEVVYGNYEPQVQNRVQEWASLAYVPPKIFRSNKKMRGPCIASCMLKKQVLESVGYFPNYRAAEDLVLMEKVEKSGAKICWAPNATVTWEAQPSLWKTFQRFSTYSCHNVWAGRQRFWHYGVAKLYVIGILIVILAICVSLWLLLLVPVAFFLRILRSIWQRREYHPISWVLNPLRMSGVGLMLLILDAATFHGWIKACVDNNPYLSTIIHRDK